MSTLAVSLHRLGDLIMHAHVLKTLNEKESTDLHLLTHPFYESIEFLFPFVKEVHVFERSYCQHSIGEPQFNKRWPFLHIEGLLSNLNNVAFKNLIDFSQTDTSARWVTCIAAQNKIGVCYDSSLKKKKFCSDNQAIQYLHSHPRSAYHFIDLFRCSLSLPSESLPVAVAPRDRDSLIVLQTQSSDLKKNWPFRKWQELVWKIAADFPDYQIVILASPSEYKDLRKEYSHIPATGSVVCTSMQESFELLKKACLLISLDTAIKHLATWTQTPIIEIAVGSSSPLETGAYQKDALILQPQVACHPCPHSSQCAYPEFLCHGAIDVDSVCAAIRFRLSGETAKKQGSIFSVYQTAQGFWSLRPISTTQEETHARRYQEPTQNHY